MTAVFTLAGFISYTDRLILGSLIDPIKAELALSDSQLGLLQGAAFAFVYIAAGLAFGRVADRVRRRVLLLVAGSLIWCLGTIACGFAQGFAGLFAARMVVGIGEATLAPAAVSLLAATVPPARLATAIGAFVMGTIVGGPGAIATSGGLLAYFEGHAGMGLSPWRLVLLSVGLAGLILPVLFLTLREPARAAAETAVPLREVIAIFRGRIGVLLPIYLGLALLSIGDFGLLTWAPSLLTRNFGMGPGEVAMLFGIGVSAAGIAGSLGGGSLLDWLGTRHGLAGRLGWIVLAAMLAAVSAAAMALPSRIAVGAAVLAWTLMSALVAIGGIATLQQLVPPSCRGVAMSLVSFFAILIGLGFGPSLIAAVTDWIFADPAAIGFAIACVCTPAASIGAALFAKSRKATRAVE
jgi:MFS family permease